MRAETFCPAAAAQAARILDERGRRRVKRELEEARELDPQAGICVVRVDDLDTTARNPSVYATFRGPAASRCYEDGTFAVQVCYGSRYPFKPPYVRFTHQMFHPNVSANGRMIDWTKLGEDWHPGWTLSKLLVELRSYIGDTRCDVHGMCTTEDPPPTTFRGLTLAEGGGQKVYVVGHEAASAFLTDRDMAEVKARAHTLKHARGHVFD